MKRKPTLVALDFRVSRANRYVPKPTGGFFREEANIGVPGERVDIAWGDDTHRQGIEEFRTGRLPGQKGEAA